jgi:hypothetical protein
VIVSFADCNGEYEILLMSVIEKHIKITDDIDDVSFCKQNLTIDLLKEMAYQGMQL